MQTIRSIAPISKLFRTSGSRPVLVMAEDYADYVCKYSIGTPANKLLIEYLGYRFAELWEISMPEVAFIQILPEHIPDWIVQEGIQRLYFQGLVFGSKYLEHSTEINKVAISSWQTKTSQLKRIRNKEDLLKIGLFDIWLSNEDRVDNNSNLLITSTDQGQELMAIDHEKCLNSGLGPEHPTYQLNENDSILCTDLVSVLIPKKSDLEAYSASLLEEFPIFVERCSEQLAQILMDIPEEWRINRINVEGYLRDNILTETWLAETTSNFKGFLNLE